jgi:hypothetical protein
MDDVPPSPLLVRGRHQERRCPAEDRPLDTGQRVAASRGVNSGILKAEGRNGYPGNAPIGQVCQQPVTNGPVVADQDAPGERGGKDWKRHKRPAGLFHDDQQLRQAIPLSAELRRDRQARKPQLLDGLAPHARASGEAWQADSDIRWRELLLEEAAYGRAQLVMLRRVGEIHIVPVNLGWTESSILY